MRDLDENPVAEDAAPTAGRWSRFLGWFFRDSEDPRHMRRLSDHLLRDIGLSRAQARDLFDHRRDPRF
jgi:hypothetical protein